MENRTYLFILLLFIFLFHSCKFQSYKNYDYPAYDGALRWTEITKKAEWSERFDHEAVTFNDKLWVFGGYNPGQVSGDTYYEDIWSSSDGKTWVLEEAWAPWKGRRGHEVLVFDDGTGDAIYLIGGFSVDEETGYRNYCNDVWRSTDGVNWEQIKDISYPDQDASDDWYPRMHHVCLSVNRNGTDYIYLIAGRTLLDGVNGRYASVYFNDLWRTQNGINWEKVLCNDFGIRSEHAACTDPDGNIYINGGVHGVIFENEDNSSHPIPDWQALWINENDDIWEAHTEPDIVEDGLLFRSGHQMVFYNGILWVLSGKTVSNEHYLFGDRHHYPIWTYDPSAGVWNVDSWGTDIDARHSYEALVWEGKIWILGGFTSSSGQSNDVWTGELQ